jgi:hypothetical protein
MARQSQSDPYYRREVHRRLTHELLTASEHLRLSLPRGVLSEIGGAKILYERAVHRYEEFAARGIVLEDLQDITY